MFRRLIGWITGQTERLQRMRERAGRLFITDEFLRLQDSISLQGRLDAKRHAAMSGGILAIGRGLEILVERVKEEDLGVFSYDISANDLYELSKDDREIVWESGANYFNDIIPVRLVGVDCCDLEAADRIMAWKRKCVSRIIQEQVVDAIKEQQS